MPFLSHHHADGGVPRARSRDLRRAARAGPEIAVELDALLDREPRRNEGPYLAALLGVEGPATVMLHGLAPVANQFRTVEALASLLACVALERPVVVAIDDVHWADDSSLRTIERLLPLAERYPILFVLALRNDAAFPAFGLLARAEQISDAGRGSGAGRSARAAVKIWRCWPRSSERMSFQGPWHSASSKRLPGIHSSSRNSCARWKTPGCWCETGPLWRYVHDVDVHVPANVERIIVARIDRLSDLPRDALTAASVLGRRFSAELLALILEEGTEVPTALDELVRLDLVRPEFGPSGSAFVFKHALIQEAAYGTLLLKRRRELHRRAAKALESFEGAPDAPSGELAIHLQGAGELAASDRLPVATRPVRRCVFQRSSKLASIWISPKCCSAELAVAANGSAGGGALSTPGGRSRSSGRFRGWSGGPRSGAGSGDVCAPRRRARMRALAELGSLQAGSSDYRAAIPDLEGALELAERLERARDIIGALSRLSIVRTNLLDLQGAFLAGERALEIARASDEEEAVAEALDAIQVASVMVGDFDRVDTLADELSAIYRRRGEMWYLQYAVYQSYLGTTCPRRLGDGDPTPR